MDAHLDVLTVVVLNVDFKSFAPSSGLGLILGCAAAST